MKTFDFKPDFKFDLKSFEGIKTGAGLKTRYIKPPKTKDIPEHRLKYQNAQKLAKELIFEEGSRYFVIVDGTFIFGDLIEAFILHNKARCKKMTISTLSMSQNNVDSLKNLLEGGWIDELNLIVSDYFFSHERHALVKYIYQELDLEDKFQLAVASTHCKLCIFETYGGKKIIMHGSANLRSSSNIEQIMLEENKELYDFNDEFQDSIIKIYKTINKSLRRTKLWDTVNLKN